MRVFISYTVADQDIVDLFYTSLKKNGFNPWMDKYELLPGQKWDLTLKENMRDSDVVITFISKNSIDKSGYVQRELNFFSDKQQEMVDHRIFLIPVILDDCKIPEKIKDIQYAIVKNGPNSSQWQRVIQSLKLASAQRGLKILAPEDYNNEYFDTCNKRIIKTIGKIPCTRYDISYPEFLSQDFPDIAKIISCFFSGNAHTNLLKPFHSLWENYESHQEPSLYFNKDYEHTFTNEIIENYEILFMNKNFISICVRQYWYGAGAAHGNHNAEFFTFHYNQADEVCLINPLDFFEASSLDVNFREALSSAIIEAFHEEFFNRTDESCSNDEYLKELIVKFLNNDYTLKTGLYKDGIIVYFAPYEIHAFSFGDWDLKIQFSKMHKFLTKDTTDLYKIWRTSKIKNTKEE